LVWPASSTSPSTSPNLRKMLIQIFPAVGQSRRVLETSATGTPVSPTG
jgi:hypothetical protein